MEQMSEIENIPNSQMQAIWFLATTWGVTEPRSMNIFPNNLLYRSLLALNIDASHNLRIRAEKF